MTNEEYLRSISDDPEIKKYKCPKCGEVANPCDPRWRWTGDRWQHHHGYPLGHVDADYEGDELPITKQESK